MGILAKIWSDKSFKIAVFFLIALIIVILTFKRSPDNDIPHIDKLESKLRMLNSINYHLIVNNQKIGTDLVLKIDSIAALKSEMVDIEYKNNLLTKYNENKIRNIGNFNVSRLESAFAARYPPR